MGTNKEFMKDFISAGDEIYIGHVDKISTAKGDFYVFDAFKINKNGISPVRHTYSTFDNVNSGFKYRIKGISSVRYYKSKITLYEEVSLHVELEEIN